MTARGTVSAALGSHSPLYRIGSNAGRLTAISPAHHLSVSFGHSGISVASGAARVLLHLNAMGYGSSLSPVGAVAPRANANRVVYSHRGVDEWYVNGPLGLEQGFTLAHAPRGAAQAPLVLSIALSGNAHATLGSGGRSITFNRTEAAVLHYGGLSATDAGGHSLRSWFQLVAGRVQLHVDTHGARYPVRIDPLIQTAELRSSAASEWLGGAVAVSGDTIVVGAPAQDVGGNELQGAAYVFVRPASGWANATETAELKSSDGAKFDEFGVSVAISGETIVIGAPRHSFGAAYVFVRPASGWASMTQTAELGGIGGFYGRVAVLGDTIVVGAPTSGISSETGSAYVYVKPASGWVDAVAPTATLTASDGVRGDEFGYSAAMSGDAIVVGAPFHHAAMNSGEGTAYVFVRPASGWAGALQQTAELTASDGKFNDMFGFSVAISGGTVVSGAFQHEVSSTPEVGAAYVFTEPPSGWVDANQAAELTASDGSRFDYLGYSVAVSANVVVAGAFQHKDGPFTADGAAYVFEMPPSGWTNATESSQIAASDGSYNDYFGFSVAAGDGVVLAGAPRHAGQGAAYVFSGLPLEAPEYGRCVRVQAAKEGKKTVYHGNFTTATCLAKSETRSGRYEWLPGLAKDGFTTQAEGPITLEAVTKVKMTCESESGAGHFDGSRAMADVVLHFNGCESSGHKCTTPGRAEGELATSTLEGRIGWEVRASKKVALDLLPAGSAVSVLEYQCAGEALTSVEGSVLVPVVEGKMLASATLKFRAAKGKQKPEGFEGGARDVLLSSLGGDVFKQVGLTVTMTEVGEEAMEVNTAV